MTSANPTKASPKTLEPAYTPSGIEVPVVVTKDMVDNVDPSLPGEYPFTRGIFPNGYRGRQWTMRQYSGFGTAEQSNERYKFLLEQGQTGLSVALDLPTQIGYDPADPIAKPEIGKVGVSLSNLAEMEILFRDIDLSQISTSFTINGTAAIIYAMYVAAADKAGVDRSKLTGTIQNDILKEYVARGTWIFPVRPSMRLIADSILYANETSPRFNPISIAGAHVRDAGCTAVEEMAYTLANGLAYVDELLRRGGDIDQFASSLSFFFNPLVFINDHLRCLWIALEQLGNTRTFVLTLVLVHTHNNPVAVIRRSFSLSCTLCHFLLDVTVLNRFFDTAVMINIFDDFQNFSFHLVSQVFNEITAT